jgi:hypothetical protein
MSVLIQEARGVADGLTHEGMPFAAGLMRRLADALDATRVELEGRKKCHEEAMEALKAAQAGLQDAAGILESIRRLPEPEGFVFQHVIKTLRQWKADRGPAPLFVAGEDIDQLEAWGKDLLKSHHETLQALSRPRQGV